jgi:hypothetical protein
MIFYGKRYDYIYFEETGMLNFGNFEFKFEY